MTRSGIIAGVAGAAVIFAAGWFLGSKWNTRSTTPRDPSPDRAESYSSSQPLEFSQRARHGQKLAVTVCGSCHLFPEPELLTKAEWTHEILPSMAQWLGLRLVDYEGMKDGKMIQEARVFPTEPAIRMEDWLAIWDYYATASPEKPLPQPARPAGAGRSTLFRGRKLNFHAGLPAISLVQIDPAQQRLYVGDAYARLLAALDPSGRVLSRTRVASPPVSLAMHQQGIYASLIGQLFPSDSAEGSVVRLSRTDTDASPETLLDQLRRPTDAKAADLNGDGRLDLVACSYGNRLGRFSWYETKADGQFEEHVLIDRPGALRTELHDFNRDGRMDIIVMTAQAREGIYLFFNEGQGRFRAQTIVEQHPSFGYAAFQLVDFNRDGHLDLLTVNGDNGDYATPHKRYHGLRLLLNDGAGQFRETWFYPLAGAYQARAADFDLDGDLDIAAIAYYPDFSVPTVESFVYLENKGGTTFTPHSHADGDAGRWMVMDTGDLDGDGDIDLALGSFLAGPTTIPVPAAMREHWRLNGAAVLVLENLRK